VLCLRTIGRSSMLAVTDPLSCAAACLCMAVTPLQQLVLQLSGRLASCKCCQRRGLQGVCVGGVARQVDRQILWRMCCVLISGGGGVCQCRFGCRAIEPEDQAAVPGGVDAASLMGAGGCQRSGPAREPPGPGEVQLRASGAGCNMTSWQTATHARMPRTLSLDQASWTPPLVSASDIVATPLTCRQTAATVAARIAGWGAHQLRLQLVPRVRKLHRIGLCCDRCALLWPTR
jgi:hypothetical protein